jgi:hypothetical protein
MARESADIPYSMRKVYRRFERWRSAHTARLPIPERLAQDGRCWPCWRGWQTGGSAPTEKSFRKVAIGRDGRVQSCRFRDQKGD